MQALREFDCVVVGAGLAGAALATGLAQLGLRVLALDGRARAAAAPGRDVRGLALSQSSQRVLEALGVWPGLLPRLTPIREVHVSALGHFGSTTLRAASLDLEALGHVCPADHLLAELDAVMDRTSGLVVAHETHLQAVHDNDPACVGLELANAEGVHRLSARLLVAADGSQSFVRRHFGIEGRTRDYDQVAIVANVDVEHAAPGTAYERFTDAGPMALLPLDGRKRYVLVRTARTHDAHALAAASDVDYLADAQRRLGWRLGRLLNLGERRTHALRLDRAERLTAPRTVLVGNAANTIHPNAAQGLNLALRDVATLLDVLAAPAQTGGDTGVPSLLEGYAERRREDHERTAGFSDGLARLFGLEGALPTFARGAALMACDLVPPLREALMARLMGLHGTSSNAWLRRAHERR